MANIKISEEKINVIKDICKSFGNRAQIKKNYG